ncbi:hypothetical protein AMTRI_Chr04g253410 [Amborella trichopoda]
MGLGITTNASEACNQREFTIWFPPGFTSTDRSIRFFRLRWCGECRLLLDRGGVKFGVKAKRVFREEVRVEEMGGRVITSSGSPLWETREVEDDHYLFCHGAPAVDPS